MCTHSIKQRLIQAPWIRFAQLLPGFFIIALITVSCTANQTQQAPPPEFQLVAEVDLAAQSYDEETVGEFTVAETAVTSIFYAIPNIDTGYFDLSLIGPDGDSYLILHSENYRTDANGGGQWEQNLSPGVYQLALTVPQSPGILSIYWNSWSASN